ncbi:MAG TPA: TonB family protein, partial [Rhizomicrobium sp.]
SLGGERVIAITIVMLMHAVVIAVLLTSLHGASAHRGGSSDTGMGMVVNVSITSPSKPPLSSGERAGPASVPDTHVEATPKYPELRNPQLQSGANVAAAASVGSGISTSDSTQSSEAPSIAVGSTDVASEFERQLLAHIEPYRHYPTGVGRDRPTGVVEIMFAMDRDGIVTGVWIKQSSGYPILDQEAVATVLRAQPLPHIPQDLPSPLNIALPVSFAPPS